MNYPPPLFGGDAAVESFIRGYCGWHIAPWFTETVTVVGSGAGSILLPSLLVETVDAVSDSGPGYAGAGFTFSRSGVLYRTDGFWSSAPYGVTVTFKHGYDECPPELVEVAGRLTKAGVSGVAAGSSMRVGNVQISGGGSSAAGLDPYCAAVLDRYRVR